MKTPAHAILSRSPKTSLIVHLLALGMVFGIGSCGIVEPEPIVGNMEPPFTSTAIQISGLFPGQVVNGTVMITIDSLPPGMNGGGIELFIDGMGVASGITHQWSFDTRYLTNGEHTLKIYVGILRSPSVGLLNLVRDFRMVYAIPFVVSNPHGRASQALRTEARVVVRSGHHDTKAPL
jgi:hypothetical protein